MELKDIIVKPVFTEKSMLAAKEGKYTFAVLKKANKPDIKKAVGSLFNVKVAGVSTIKIHGKKKKVVRQKRETQRPDYKKAVVFLEKGQKIDIFETQGEKKNA